MTTIIKNKRIYLRLINSKFIKTIDYILETKNNLIRKTNKTRELRIFNILLNKAGRNINII